MATITQITQCAESPFDLVAFRAAIQAPCVTCGAPLVNRDGDYLCLVAWAAFIAIPEGEVIEENHGHILSHLGRSWLRDADEILGEVDA